MSGHILHAGFERPGEHGLIQEYAKSVGREYVFRNLKKGLFEDALEVKTASLVVIWNGNWLCGPLVKKVCEQRNIPHFFMEWGLMPQKGYFLVDPGGMCGDSILQRDISWVNEEDMENLYRIRSELQKEHDMTDENFVLIPLQVHNDAQVLYNTPYNNMEEMVEHVKYLYPNQKIIARRHPDSKKNKRNFPGVEDNFEGTFYDWAKKCSIVVGGTSTCLYEAAILGKPVNALGRHPLRGRRVSEIDRVLAGILALRVKKEGGDLRSVLDRFNIKPL